jgi:hypothetical protein
VNAQIPKIRAPKGKTVILSNNFEYVYVLYVDFPLDRTVSRQ